MTVKNSPETAAQANKVSDVESKAILAVAPELHTTLATLANTQRELSAQPKVSAIVKQQTELLFSDADNVERALHLALAQLRAVKTRTDKTLYGLELCNRTLDKLSEVRAASGDKQLRLMDEAIALYARCAPWVTTSGSTMRDTATGAEYKADKDSVQRASLRMVKRTMNAAVKLAPVYISETHRGELRTIRAAQELKAAKAAEAAITGGKPVVDSAPEATTQPTGN